MDGENGLEQGEGRVRRNGEKKKRMGRREKWDKNMDGEKGEEREKIWGN
jgi:hypothetical protein